MACPIEPDLGRQGSPVAARGPFAILSERVDGRRLNGWADLPLPKADRRQRCWVGQRQTAGLPRRARGPLAASLAWNGKSNTLILRAAAHLDLTMLDQVQQAIECLRIAAPETLVVDMKATEKAFDSGLDLMLLLNRYAGHLKKPVYFTRCTSHVKSRLTRAGVHGNVRVS
jgi:hypothetical protein